MDGWVSIGTKLDTKSFDAQIEQVQRKLEDVEATIEGGQTGVFKLTESEMVDLGAEAERLRNRLKGLKDQQDKLEKSNLVSVKRIMEDIGNSTGKVIKQVGRWTLAVFGVRAVYGFVRNAVSTLSQYNEQLATDIEYIRYAVAVSLQGAVNNLIKLAYKLLVYIDYLANAWFGVSLFANASADAMKKSAGSAEKMRKSLQGFDEMNIISDSSGATGGGATPSVDLSEIRNMEEPKWLIMVKDLGQWIIDNWQEVIYGLLLTKLFIDLLTGNWLGFIIDLVGLLVIAFFKVKDAIVALYVNGKEILKMFVNWIYEKVIKPIGDFFASVWEGITLGFNKAVNGIKKAFNSVVNFFKNIINTIVGLFKKIGTKVGDAIGSAFKTVVNGVLKAIENILNFPIKSINKLINVINKVPGINLGTLPTFNLPRLAVGGIVNMPSRGVPIGGAIAGEAGAEGVIPLTNSQAMETLGQAIGKYVTINANITNTMNGRVISRELQKVNSSSDFAFNR